MAHPSHQMERTNQSTLLVGSSHILQVTWGTRTSLVESHGEIQPSPGQTKLQEHHPIAFLHKPLASHRITTAKTITHHHLPPVSTVFVNMVQIRFTLSTPLSETTINDITSALRKINNKTVLTSRNPSAGEVFFACLDSGESDLDAFGELCQQWLQGPNPKILVYNMVLE